MKNPAVNQKVEEIRKDLETWARQENILQPGEFIVFSMKIEKRPIIEQKEKNPSIYHEMSPKDFFAADHLANLGMPHRQAAIVRNAIWRENTRWNTPSGEAEQIHKTMREFVDHFNEQKLMNFRGIGKIIGQNLLDVLRKTGF